MQRIRIFEPPSCCAGGACGPVVDPEMARLNDALRRLSRQGIEVERVLLNQSPKLFLEHPEVAELIKKDGTKALPITVVENRVLLAGRYPTFEEMVGAVGT